MEWIFPVSLRSDCIGFCLVSCRVTLRPVRMRLPPSGITTGCYSASANTSTTPSSMGKMGWHLSLLQRNKVFPSNVMCILPLKWCKTIFFLFFFSNYFFFLSLLRRLQDISSGYWVLVLHFTRREAVRQIDELQHIATNLGRSEFRPVSSQVVRVTQAGTASIKNCAPRCAGRAWLYLALSESSLESYLRLFQENQALLHKYYFK